MRRIPAQTPIFERPRAVRSSPAGQAASAWRNRAAGRVRPGPGLAAPAATASARCWCGARSSGSSPSSSSASPSSSRNLRATPPAPRSLPAQRRRQHSVERRTLGMPTRPSRSMSTATSAVPPASSSPPNGPRRASWITTSPPARRSCLHDYLTIDAGDGATASRDAANAAWCAADQGKVLGHARLALRQPVPHRKRRRHSRCPGSPTSARRPASTCRSIKPAWIRHSRRSDRSRETAKPAQVTATPSILVNGRYVAGANANSWPTYD